MTQRTLWSSLPLILVVLAIMVVIMWPFTNPWIIQTKVHLSGPKVVYKPLAYREDLWDIVLTGVKTGNKKWLRVAVALFPALDIHPGEEMISAVSTVIDKNPSGAIDVLIPIYGPDIVCGYQDEEEPVTLLTAERRLNLLSRIESSIKNVKALEGCRQVIKKNLQPFNN